jgi:ethanolamine permease
MDSLTRVSYRTVPDGFFARRKLRRHARTWSVLAFGVGAVIAGEFAGWNPGLHHGGFGGLLVATLLISLMYIAMCCSLAEMATAMPFAGAAYAYSRVAMGAWGGFLAGLAQCVAALLTSAVFVVQIGDTLEPAVERLTGVDVPRPIWWAILYFIFCWINIYSVALFFRVAATLCFSAIAVLLLYFGESLPFFEMHLALNTPTQLGATPWLPNGLVSVAWALPFAIWFYVDIEQAPMAAEETHAPERVMPPALIYGVLILSVLALGVLFLNSGVPPGAAAISEAKEPLLVAFQSVLVFHFADSILPLLYLVGIVASFHTSVYAYSRAIYALSRAGYIPTELSLTHTRRQTPHYAILAGTFLAYGIALAIFLAPSNSPLSVILINMSAFPALISYMFTMTSYVILTRDYPHMKRPFTSPLGVTGAITALLLASAAVLLLFANPEFRPGLLGCAAILAGGILYFMLRRRHRLVAAPEEVFAMEMERARPRPVPAAAVAATD